MAQASKTAMTTMFGGGRGYYNIGGWNTTLTDRSSSAKEVVGIFRQEGANLYVYAAQGTTTATAQSWQQIGTSITIGTDNTDGVISPIVFTTIIAGGTEQYGLIKAMAFQTCSGQTYGWYFIRGFCTVQLQTNTVAVSAFGQAIGPSTDSHAKVKIATASAALPGIGKGWAMTAALACDISGPAYISLWGNWNP